MSQDVYAPGPTGRNVTGHIAVIEQDPTAIESVAGAEDATIAGRYWFTFTYAGSGLFYFWMTDDDDNDAVLGQASTNLAGEGGTAEAGNTSGGSIQVVAAAEVEITANDDLQIVIGDAAQTTIGNTSTISATVTIADVPQTTGTCSATFKDTANTTLTNGSVTMSHVAAGTWSGTIPANMTYPVNRHGKATVAFTDGSNNGKRTIPVTFVERT